MTTISQLAEVVDRAGTDPAFRQRLLSAPAATLQEAGIDVPAGSEVRVLENTDSLRHFVLPGRPDGLGDDDLAQSASPSGDAATDTLLAHARLVADTWTDGALKARLLSDPAAVMAERGIALPAGTDVRVVEAADGVLNLVLPPAVSR